MDRLIPIINKLQDVFATVGAAAIDLPQIAVVGSQSTGKSSVLESLVGRDFLPRGSDIVTRRPLILQLINTHTGYGFTEDTMSINNNINNNNNDNDEKHGSNGSVTTTHANGANNNDDNNNNKDNNKKKEKLEWGEFLHCKDKKFYDFNEIRKEIRKETERVAPNKAVSHEPINLKIYSPKVLNLTLIDLPGMTKVPVANQPIDIEQRIKKLLYSYISKPRCLILAISSATSDLATSDGIQFAIKADPKGGRTLGVITKIDLMDQGTNALDMLSGNTIPLQLGYVGVVNRSQKDINDGKSVDQALRDERGYFKQHPAYRSISSFCGIPYLAKKLNQILINHIKRELPGLRIQIQSNISDLHEELRSYGQPISVQYGSDSNNNKGALLLNLISKFSENFTNAIDGSGVMIMNQINKNKKAHQKMLMDARAGGGGGGGQQPGQRGGPNQQRRDSLNKYGIHSNFLENDRNFGSNVNVKDLFGGARILYIFRTEFQSELQKIEPFDGLSDDFILNSIRNASGVRSSLFIPEMCFENLVKMQIEKLRKPCVNCVEMVYEELQRIGGQCETPEIARFTKFRNALSDCVNRMLKRHLDPCRRFVEQLIDIELAYVNTNHPDFISMDDVFSERVQQEQQFNRQGGPPQQYAGNNQQMRYQQHGPKQRSDNMSVASHRDNTNPFHDNNNRNNQNRQSQNLKSVPPPQNDSTKSSHKPQQSKQQKSFGLFGFMGGSSDNRSKDESNNNDSKHSTSNQAPPKPQQPVPQPQSHQNQQIQNYPQPSQYQNFKMQGGRMSDATQREQLELLVIKRFIKSYFEIVKKNIADLVPKSIMFLLVNQSKQKLQQDLALSLYKEEQFNQLLSEDPEIAQKRKAAQELLAILQKALDIINEVRDYKLD